MAQIVFLDGENMGHVIPLRSANSLGRAKNSTIVFSESSILERHAIIAYREGQYRISRADSNAVVALNGKPVATDEVLNHGDIISLGDMTVLFSDETPSPPSDYLRRETPNPDTALSLVQSRIKHFENADDVVSAFRKSERLAAHLETLYRVSATITMRVKLEELINELLGIIFEILKPDRAFILLHDELGSLRVRGQRTSENSRLQGFVRVSRTIINEAIHKKEAILTKDATTDQRFSLGASIVDQHIQSSMCVPLIKQDRILGAIVIDTLTSVKTYGSEDLNLLNAVATQAAVAIDNILLFDETVNYSRKLLKLGETSQHISSYLEQDPIIQEAVQSVCRIFDCSKCTILLLDKTEGDLTVVASSHIDPKTWAEIRIKPGEGFCGTVLRDNKPLLVKDSRILPSAGRRPYDSTSFLIVPIVSHAEGMLESKTTGVICATDKTEQQIFDTNDQEFLTIFATQLGITLNNSRLFERATVDTLTRVFTRQFFFFKLEEMIALARAKTHPLCLLMADLDHFKHKNDHYGHQVGDQILAELGKILKHTIKANGIVGRYGGEEFIVSLPTMSEEEARETAENVRKAVENHSFGTPEQPIACTLSLGLALFSPEDTADSLVRKADAALYRAKNSGRNRVEAHRAQTATQTSQGAVHS